MIRKINWCKLITSTRLPSVLSKQIYSVQIIPTPAELKPASTELYRKNNFADKVRIYVRGGTGGQGSAIGTGGDGGHVFIQCKEGASFNLKTRSSRRIIAEHGQNFISSKLKKPKAKNRYITVPIGTEVRTADNDFITDLVTPNDIVCVARGGVGGSRKTVNYNGQKGERRNISLELKLIADVSLTGFPNAGKSSLLRALSRARPKVGIYPFTTIKPMVGSVFYTDGRQITIADLPGLIEEAHLNKGMGHKFLRHIERTNLILLVVDVNGFQLKEGASYRSPLETVILLLKELVLYQDAVFSKPFFMVLNKMDSPGADENKEDFLKELKTVDNSHPLLVQEPYADDILQMLKMFSSNNIEKIFTISALKQAGLDPVRDCLYRSLLLKSENVVGNNI